MLAYFREPELRKIEEFNAIQAAMGQLLNHQKKPLVSTWEGLVATLKQRFVEGKRDFYCWDEMTKATEMKFLLESDLQPGPVIELCCGSAYWTRETIKPIDVGIDLFPDEGLYARSIQHFAEDQNFADETYRSLLQADVTKALPFPDHSVSHVISFCALEHIAHEKYPGLFNEVKRILKPGGTFIFSVQSKWCFDSFEKILEPQLVHEIRQNAQMGTLFGLEEWTNMIRDFGFTFKRKKKAIDQERSAMYVLSFAPGGFQTNPLVKKYSEWLRQGDLFFFEDALTWLSDWVDTERADLFFFELKP